MPKTERQKAAADKYLKEKVETFVIRVPKGYKTTLQARASTQGESLNAFVTTAIDERIARLDGSQPARVKVSMLEADDTPAEPIRVFVRQTDDSPEKGVTQNAPLAPERDNPEPDIRSDTTAKPAAGDTSAVAPAEAQLSIFPPDPDAKPKRVNPPPIPAEVREACRQDYVTGMAVADIAAKHKLPRTTVASWVRRGNWERGANIGI